jgi:hypothetical protein
VLQTQVCYTCHAIRNEAKDLLGVEFLGTVPIDLSDIDFKQFDSKIIKGRSVYNVKYALEVKMAAKEGVLCFQVICGGQNIGSVEMEYAKD